MPGQGDKYANTLRHDQSHPDFNPQFRQLLHCGYKVAAEFGDTYFNALDKYKDIVLEKCNRKYF